MKREREITARPSELSESVLGGFPHVDDYGRGPATSGCRHIRRAPTMAEQERPPREDDE